MATVVGLFEEFGSAQSAVADLENNGFAHGDISVVRGSGVGTVEERGDTDTYGDTYGDSPATDGAADGAGAGATAGTAVGGTVGLMAGLGALAIPGFGPIVAAGPLIAALTGAGIGAATGAVGGGLVGGLMNAGVAEGDARRYSDGVRDGGTLVTVHCDDSMAEDASAILRRHRPVEFEERAAGFAGGSGGSTAAHATTDTDASSADLRMERDTAPGSVEDDIDLTNNSSPVDTGLARMNRAASAGMPPRDAASRMPHTDADTTEALVSEQEQSDPATTARPGRMEGF